MRWRSVLWVRNSVRRVAILVLITGFLVGGLTFPEPVHSQEYPGLDQLKAWFPQRIENLKIDFFNDSAGIPPKVIISEREQAGRPNITFQLYHVSGEGSDFSRNIEWYTFTAYETETKRALNNFYLLINDNVESFFYYDPDNDLDGVIKGKFGETFKPQDPTVSSESVGTLAAYIMNYYPYDGKDKFGDDFLADCSIAADRGRAKTVTGPKGKGLVEEPDQNSLLEVGLTLDHARSMNQNCMNRDENGWLAYWKVGSQSAFSGTGEDNCTLTWIVDGGSLLGLFTGPNDPPAILDRLGIKESQLTNPFLRLSLCLYIWTILPMTEWAAGLITDVGGIALIESPYLLLTDKQNYWYRNA